VHRAPPGDPCAEMTFGPARSFAAGMTVRQVLYVQCAGGPLRLHLSNEYGRTPLRLAGLRAAGHLGAGRIDPATDVVVMVGGEPAVTIAPGGTAVTDPIPLTATDGTEIAVSITVADETGPATCHPTGRRVGYAFAGPADAACPPPGAEPLGSQFWITGVDAQGVPPGPVVVAFGDSLTDGDGTGLRYPDALARLLRRPVPNQGMSGNRLLRDGYWTAGLSRFDRDVLAVPGATHVIIELGTNDLGFTGHFGLPEPTAEALTGGLATLAARARAAGIVPIAATLPPAAGTTLENFATPESAALRRTVNAWLRTTDAFSAILDLDRAWDDPADPGHLNPAYDCGDHLHPNDAGAIAFAFAFDPTILTAARR
jgi:lysophospholipase L1-like esterase